MDRLLRAAAAAVTLATASTIAVPALAAEYNLKLAHFMPPTHNQAENVLPEWARRIEEQSDGRIHIELYPAGQLLKITDIFEGVRSGVADLGYSVPSATTGRFPLTSLLELPYMFDSAEEASKAAMMAVEDGAYDDEYAGVKLIYLHTLTPSGVHTRETPIDSVDDFDGLRIRFPSPTMKLVLEELGATPVGVAAPQLYEQLDKGVIDGLAGSFEGMKGLRLGEVTNYSTDLRMYTLAFYLVMNQQVYDSMPPELQKVIDDNSGIEEAARVGRSWDEEEVRGRQVMLDLDGEIVELSEEETDRLHAVVDPVTETYLDDLEANAVPARAVYDRLKDAAASLD